MKRKIDIGEDKNLLIKKAASAEQPQVSFLMDDLPATADDAYQEARKIAWPNWFNSEPLLIGHLDDDGKAYLFYISELIRNRVVVLDVWDYTLLPCRRSLSYILEWHRRYSSAGLVTIGVHSPLFEFGKDKKNIMLACRALGITYPVVLDNDFNIWRSLENRYWPRRVLIDAQGRTHKDDVGEGSYAEFEKTIQVLLRELSPGLACPPIMKAVREVDRAGCAIPQVTPEIFLGFNRRPRFANAQIVHSLNEEVRFKDESNGTYAPELPYLDGTWQIRAESIVGTAYKSKEQNSLSVKFQATDVYVVAAARPKNPADIPQVAKVQVWLNKKAMPEDRLGEDVSLNEYRRGICVVKEPRLYHLATKLEQGLHEISLQIDGEGDGADTLELFAFFFEHRA